MIMTPRLSRKRCSASSSSESCRAALAPPVRGGSGVKRELGAGAQRHDRPCDVVLGEDAAHAGHEAVAEREHGVEGVSREDFFQRRAGGRE